MLLTPNSFSRTSSGKAASNTAGTTNRIDASGSGNSTNTIATITGLKLGELIIAARVNRVLAPPTSKLWATGVAQFVHTPSGAPTTAPQSTFPAADENRFGAAIPASNVIIAAPNGSAKYIPNRFVYSQFTLVRMTLIGAGISGVTFSRASNEIDPATFTSVPACNFFKSAGYRC